MAVDRGVASTVARQVEFILDDEFVDRLRQLRSLVPLLTSLSERRDLVIDRVRARIPRAVWRVGEGPEVVMERSGLVVAPDGLFCCAARIKDTRERWQTPHASIPRLIEAHVSLVQGEPLRVFSELR